MGEYFTPKEVAEKLKIDRQTVYRMVSDGRLKADRVGARGLRIRGESVAAVLRPVKR